MQKSKIPATKIGGSASGGKNQNYKLKFKISLLVVLCLFFMAQDSLRSQEIKDAKPFSLESLDGKMVNSEDYFGKQVVLLNFWATWCPACNEEIPHLEKLHSEYKDKVAIFAIDIKESKQKLERFAKARAIEYTILMDKDGAVTDDYGVQGIPSIILVGKDKKVAYFGHNIFEAEKKLESLLK